MLVKQKQKQMKTTNNMTTELNWMKKGKFSVSEKNNFRFVMCKTNYGFYVLNIYKPNGEVISEMYDTKKETTYFANYYANNYTN